MHLVLPQFFIFYSWGLGEPFGKASLANTAFRLGRLIPMRDRSSRTLEGWYRYPSEAWPDEALERGLPGPLRREGKTGGGQGKMRWFYPRMNQLFFQTGFLDDQRTPSVEPRYSSPNG